MLYEYLICAGMAFKRGRMGEGGKGTMGVVSMLPANWLAKTEVNT